MGSLGHSAVQIAADNVFSAGRSAPRRFNDGYFDYNFLKFIGLTTYSGAEPGECYLAASQIEDGNAESWIQAWLSVAHHVEEQGDRALKGNHKVSAREAYLRATTYYQAAFFFITDDDPRKQQVYAKHTGCFQSAGKLFNPPFEPVSIPYEGKSLFGYYMLADNSGTLKPTVLIQMGADGSSEQIYFSGGGAAALRRGYNVLIFEGPGQTGTFMRDRSINYRHDWEAGVSAVVNYALTRSEVDPSRIALIGYSMGGYFAPRAAAFEKRLAATVASGLVPVMWDLISSRLADVKKAMAAGEPWDHSHRWLLFEHMPKYGLENDVEDLDKLEAIWRKMDLRGLEENIDKPLLVVQAAAEGAKATKAAREFFAKLSNPKNKFVLTTEEDGAEMHCQKGNASLLHAIEFDWLDEVLGWNS